MVHIQNYKRMPRLHVKGNRVVDPDLIGRGGLDVTVANVLRDLAGAQITPRITQNVNQIFAGIIEFKYARKHGDDIAADRALVKMETALEKLQRDPYMRHTLVAKLNMGHLMALMRHAGLLFHIGFPSSLSALFRDILADPIRRLVLQDALIGAQTAAPSVESLTLWFVNEINVPRRMVHQLTQTTPPLAGRVLAKPLIYRSPIARVAQIGAPLPAIERQGNSSKLKELLTRLNEQKESHIGIPSTALNFPGCWVELENPILLDRVDLSVVPSVNVEREEELCAIPRFDGNKTDPEGKRKILGYVLYPLSMVQSMAQESPDYIFHDPETREPTDNNDILRGEALEKLLEAAADVLVGE